MKALFRCGIYAGAAYAIAVITVVSQISAVEYFDGGDLRLSMSARIGVAFGLGLLYLPSAVLPIILTSIAKRLPHDRTAILIALPAGLLLGALPFALILPSFAPGTYWSESVPWGSAAGISAAIFYLLWNRERFNHA